MSETVTWLDLLADHRWAALGTIDDDGAPFVSSVAFALEGSSQPGLLMHLSQLASHTGNLLSRKASSLLIAEADHAGVKDPQSLPRLTLVGESVVIPREHEDFDGARQQYLERFPEAEMRFGFSDFHLFRFIPGRGNFVGGFGSAKKISGEKIKTSWGDSFA